METSAQNGVAGCLRCGRLGRRRSRGRTCRPATCCPRVPSVNARAFARPCPFEAPLLCHRSRDKSSPRAVRPDHGERQSPLPEIGAARNYTHFSPPVVGMPPSAPARPPACLAPTNAGWLHPGGAATGAAGARVRDASKEAPRGVYTHAKSTAGDRWYGTSMRIGAPKRQVISTTCNLAD